MEINGVKQLPQKDTPCYDAHWHEVPITNPMALKQGENTLKTLKTPLHNGEMVHGMDVQWPGIVLKVKESQARPSVLMDEVIYEGKPHLMVSSDQLIYYYDLSGGGFSRIIDTQGNDWIGFKRMPWGEYPASAASAYRGLPNLVHLSQDTGAGHPGHDKCTTEQIAPNKLKSVSKSGLWQWEWTFFDDHARLDVMKAPEETPYWFLYEGTPNGGYRPEQSFYGTDATGFTSDIPDFYRNGTQWDNFNWAYFSGQDAKTTFYTVHLTPDEPPI